MFAKTISHPIYFGNKFILLPFFMQQNFLKVTLSWVIVLFFVSSFSVSVFAESENQITASQIHIETQVKKIKSIQKIDQLLYQLESEKYGNNKDSPYLKNLLIEKRKFLEEEEPQKQIELSSKTQKILLGYSSRGREIFAYYKWDPSKPFFGIFSNIHWGYEYGTYFTAEWIKDHLEQTSKTQRFIIPTLNPDGLQIATEDNYLEYFYIKWRENAQWVELNRNFCTQDFISHSYIKKWVSFSSWKKCGSESETQVLTNLLEKFQFSEIISLHSEWGIFFIPDNSYFDPRVIFLAEKLKVLLPEYYFEFPTENEKENQKVIARVEINSWNKKKTYTGLMENYIYQNYNIPVVLIELQKHGMLESQLFEIGEYLPSLEKNSW